MNNQDQPVQKKCRLSMRKWQKFERMVAEMSRMRFLTGDAQRENAADLPKEQEESKLRYFPTVTIATDMHEETRVG